MKKTIVLLLVALPLIFSSCYNTKICVGNVTAKEPLMKVNTVWNHHIFFGLVPLGNSTMIGSEYINDSKDYVVKTNMSFLNVLISCTTFGLYAPTQTTYYLPFSIIEKK